MKSIVAHQVRFIRDITPADLIASPGRVDLPTYKAKLFLAWDVLNPSRVVECSGVNERRAIDEAIIKLSSVPFWRVRLRPAVPSDRLHSAELA